METTESRTSRYRLSQPSQSFLRDDVMIFPQIQHSPPKGPTKRCLPLSSREVFQHALADDKHLIQLPCSSPSASQNLPPFSRLSPFISVSVSCLSSPSRAERKPAMGVYTHVVPAHMSRLFVGVHLFALLPNRDCPNVQGSQGPCDEVLLLAGAGGIEPFDRVPHVGVGGFLLTGQLRTNELLPPYDSPSGI